MNRQKYLEGLEYQVFFYVLMQKRLERSWLMKQTKMSDKDYLLYLRDRQEEMRQDILMCCTTKRSCLFVDVFTVYKKLKEKYHEGWEKEQGENVILKGILQNQIAFLEARGELVSGTAKYGVGCRTVARPDGSEKAA